MAVTVVKVGREGKNRINADWVDTSTMRCETDNACHKLVNNPCVDGVTNLKQVDSAKVIKQSEDNGVKLEGNAVEQNSHANYITAGCSTNKANDYCLLFYIDNIDHDILMLNMCGNKNGWKKHSAFLETACSDFRNWKTQNDFTFGFVPLGNQVVSNGSGHITEGIEDPSNILLSSNMDCLIS